VQRGSSAEKAGLCHRHACLGADPHCQWDAPGSTSESGHLQAPGMYCFSILAVRITAYPNITLLLQAVSPCFRGLVDYAACLRVRFEGSLWLIQCSTGVTKLVNMCFKMGADDADCNSIGKHTSLAVSTAAAWKEHCNLMGCRQTVRDKEEMCSCTTRHTCAPMRLLQSQRFSGP
jgi:hypothetical protein